jgi:hypothetical protein
MFLSPGIRADFGLLEELVNSSGTVGKFINSFERSEIMRFFLLSQFKEKLMSDKDLIEKEISEFE